MVSFGLHRFFYTTSRYSTAASDILDDPFDDTAELVHDLPQRVVKCHTSRAAAGAQPGALRRLPAPLPVLNDPAAPGRPGPEVRVHVSLDLLRRLRDVELMDDLNGGPAPATVQR